MQKFNNLKILTIQKWISYKFVLCDSGREAELFSWTCVYDKYQTEEIIKTCFLQRIQKSTPDEKFIFPLSLNVSFF